MCGERRSVYRIILGKLEGRDHLEDAGVDGTVILKGSSEQGQMAGACECCNEPSGSTKCGEFLDSPRTILYLMEDPAPRSGLISYAGVGWIQVTRMEWSIAML
jgi:hypothetical protein